MIELPFDDRFVENMDATQKANGFPCVICGRSCRNPRYRVYVDSSFEHILTKEEYARDEQEMGCWPIGENCLEKHPELKAYAIKQERKRNVSVGNPT